MQETLLRTYSMFKHTHTHTHTHTPLIVGSRQRIVAGEARHVEVVFDDHDVSHFKVLIEATGCVSQHHRLHTEQLEDAYGQCDLETHARYTNIDVI